MNLAIFQNIILHSQDYLLRAFDPFHLFEYEVYNYLWLISKQHHSVHCSINFEAPLLSAKGNSVKISEKIESSPKSGLSGCHLRW